ncbi:flagellar hook-length control protein FliK [Herbaspirillum sp. SJZ099]|uniref:flagellar hook-length control protein FliK n=1 Tax=Herbaspirillum sp. SJZ099 TaxID=2572916 RepID=UPI0011A48710|nr:flagellar hook-length control protein FliK [Herbaspirillum sp. SJZ099]TWC65864.1 flagellar hook-length control protein FliK [Herbaspirillum sp. SJZ099]
MNTSLPLLNVITGSQSAATGSRSSNPADSFTADAPFNQVLNSQVSNRNAENRSQDKPRAAEAPAQPSQPAQPAAAANKAATSSSSTASSTASADKKQSDDKDEDQADDSTAQASAELLALVANLGQNAVKPATDSKGENADADLLAQAKRGISKQSSLRGDSDEQPQALGGKDKKIDFAALQGSVNANNVNNANSGKTEAVPESAQQHADAAARPAKDAKPAIDLSSADAKAAPKEDASALASRAQTAKAAPELAALKQDAPQATPAPAVMPAMQQAMAANQPRAVFAAYTDKIQPNVGSAGWDQAVGQKITWMVSGGIQSASLTLNPPDLGPLQVVLSVNNSQADATFTTAQPEVKQALEAAMPKLREMMDQAGIQLGQATVNTGMPNQQQGANGQQARAPSSSGSFGGQGEDGDIAAATGNAAVTGGGLGLVDTFA